MIIWGMAGSSVVQFFWMTVLFYNKMMRLSRGIPKERRFFSFSSGRCPGRFSGKRQKSVKKFPDRAKKKEKGIDKSEKM